MRLRTITLLGAAGLFVLAGTLSAGEKKLMHCFAYTPLESATQADFDAFYKATDELVTKIPGLTHVWYGKLRNPLPIFVPTEGATRKELMGGAKTATGPMTLYRRQYGVCMEFNDAAALAAYAKNPDHKAWVAVYNRVRDEKASGTTTYDILGQ